MHTSYIERASTILSDTLYGSLATVTPENRPWNSPVFICFDEQCSFYWASAIGSQHSQNLKNNPNAFMSIFDSSRPWGQGQGVYVSGRVTVITSRHELEKIRQLRIGRVAKATQPITDFMGASPRRIYKCSPEKIWLNVDHKVQDITVDERIEVTLIDLQTFIKNS